MSDWDTKIANAELLSSLMGPVNYLSGSPRHAFLATGLHYKADIIIVDLNPNPGPLNRCVTMTSDYIFTPAAVDMLSSESIKDLEERMIDEWSKAMNSQRPHTLPTNSPFPQEGPIWLGVVLSSTSSALDNSKTSQFMESIVQNAAVNLTNSKLAFDQQPNYILARIPRVPELMDLFHQFNLPVHFPSTDLDNDTLRHQADQLHLILRSCCYNMLRLICGHSGLNILPK